MKILKGYYMNKETKAIIKAIMLSNIATSLLSREDQRYVFTNDGKNPFFRLNSCHIEERFGRDIRMSAEESLANTCETIVNELLKKV